MSVFRKTTELLFGKKQVIQNIPPPPIPLQPYLEKAYKEAVDSGDLGEQPPGDTDAKLHVPVSIFVRGKPGHSHQYAGIHDDEVHFSASLLKVAAMFAAFSLLAEAKALAATGSFANATAFFNALKLKFHSADAVPAIRNAGVFLEPRYTDILTVTGFGGVGATTVEFVPMFYHGVDEDFALYEAYETVRTEDHLTIDAHRNRQENARSLAALAKVSHMYRMIVPSNNGSAGECIRRLGYAYINVKLMNAGFYDPASSPPKGIWLAADYLGSTRVEIDSLNDAKSAQATTSRQLARLFSLIQYEELINEESSKAMKNLLKEAHGVDVAWLKRTEDGGEVRKFYFRGVKVGLANLKPNKDPKGPDVYSEGLLLKWKGNAQDLEDRKITGELAVCWQNLRVDFFGTGTFAIAHLIEKAFFNFLKQTPI